MPVYKYKMVFVTNGVIITDAIKFVQQKKEELSKVNAENRQNTNNSDCIKSEDLKLTDVQTQDEQKQELGDSNSKTTTNTTNTTF